MNLNWHLLLSRAVCIVTSLASLPAIVTVAIQLRSGRAKDWFYADIDGDATPEALVKFSRRSRIFKGASVFFSAAGLGTSIAVVLVRSSASPSIFRHDSDGEILNDVLVTVAWGVVLLHSIGIVAVRTPTQAHTLSLLLLASALALVAPSIPHLVETIQWIHRSKDAASILDVVRIVLALLLSVSCSLLPRRPDVYVENKKKVDGQRTVSLLSRYTWSWARSIYSSAAAKGDLVPEDVPQPDHSHRSEDLLRAWHGASGSLLRDLVRHYWQKVLWLCIFTVIRCLVSIVPMYIMLRIITMLEQRDAGRACGVFEIMLLVGGMALSNLVDSWMENWAFWFSFTDLSLAIRSQLSNLVYGKALRRKDVKPTEKSEKSEKKDDEESAATDQSSGDDEDDSVAPPTTSQAAVNLVGVDIENITHFSQYGFLIINGLAKLIIFSAFLVRLMGWIPVAAGMAAWALTLPPNAILSKQLITVSAALMKTRDARLSKINEALLGIRQIKFSALERHWEAKILEARETELKTLWRMFLVDAGIFACWVVSPILLAATSLTVYVLMTGNLQPSVAFVSIGMFNTLETTLGSLPELISAGFEALVSINRIDSYLKGSEVEESLPEDTCITFEDASVAWPVEEDGDADTNTNAERFVLRNVNVSFPQGQLSVITGKTGTGKSLLLSAMIGEADVLRGSIRVPKAADDNTSLPLPLSSSNKFASWIIPASVAYVSQTPWLQNASIRDNILFGLPLDQARYDHVVHVCALETDLAHLTDGDNTELGANGVNLSGGQKWRVTLARAVYSRAEILILEDVFSATDSHVSRWIFDKCLVGEICEGRTRILVTHNWSLVRRHAKLVVELGGGTMTYAGPPQQEEIRRAPASKSPIEQDEDEDTLSRISGETAIAGDRQGDAVHAAALTSEAPPPASEDIRKFIAEETRHQGVVNKRVYATYLNASGGIYLWAICAVLFVSYQLGVLGRSWWLRTWTSQSNQVQSHYHRGSNELLMVMNYHESLQSPLQTDVLPPVDTNLAFYLGIYILISVVSAVIGVLRYYYGYFLAIRGSKILFLKMLSAILHAPLLWLDTIPTGRILNRFTADFNIVDERVVASWSLFASDLLEMIGVCAASFFASLYIIPPAVVLLFLSVLLGIRYLAASRPLKRLESNAKSPVFELINTTLVGLSTIRAFRQAAAYQAQMQDKIDTWVMTSFHLALANRWMSFRMALVAAVFCIVVGAVIVFTPSVDAALAGFTLSFMLNFSESIRWTIRCYGDMELNMNAMERVVEYSNIEPEKGGDKGTDVMRSPPAAWPTSGSVEVENLTASYAADLPPVLKDVSFRVGHNERLGVIGRTGAGKSSLTLALFRFLETRSGSVVIDGLDVSKINLYDLRSRLSIIPQDPVLFSGTLRSNLDPLNNHTDAELFDALEKVHLIEPSGDSNNDNNNNNNQGTTNRELINIDSAEDEEATPTNEDNTTAAPINIFRNLASPISPGGANLSQGQRQLLCLARAIIRQPRIIVLDEATSAVDVGTDVLIQRSLREGFTDSTLLVIAHRLSTIADFDKILVLEGGRVAEFGTPGELWERKDGVFRGMCESSSEQERQKLETAIMGTR